MVAYVEHRECGGVVTSSDLAGLPIDVGLRGLTGLDSEKRLTTGNLGDDVIVPGDGHVHSRFDPNVAGVANCRQEPLIDANFGRLNPYGLQ